MGKIPPYTLMYVAMPFSKFYKINFHHNMKNTINSIHCYPSCYPLIILNGFF